MLDKLVANGCRRIVVLPLMLLAAGFFVAEMFVVSHGALTLAGAVAFVVGSLMLFDPAGEAFDPSVHEALSTRTEDGIRLSRAS
jgi:membrane-bound ClpP family serine protease